MSTKTSKQAPQNDTAETPKALSLGEMEAQAAKLAADIAEAKAKVKAEALEKIKATADAAGLTISDIVPAFPKAVKVAAGGSVAPKYRNNATGETWSGRGLMPKWMAAAVLGGAKKADFEIKPN